VGTPLRVLMIEDDDSDHQLLLLELRRGGYVVTDRRVETPEALVAALEEPWDLVLSDYAMPRFDAPRALALVRERNVDLPFIIVSGTVDEVTAVASMRAGAHDFIAKGKLARLLPAIERELREAAVRADRRQIQEQLVVSDRMASLGTLAAGVAHEINNPLAAILANLEMALEELAALPVDDRVARAVDSLRDSCDAALRVRDVTRDLKVFSRGDEHRLGPVDVRYVLESSLRMAQNEIRHRAELVRDYEDVPPVEANDTRLGQVFLNLVVNAAQALPEGQADRQRIRVVIRPDPPGHVRVEVHDTGSGIPDHVVAHIFDPFFTTKPVGVGTGLGLAISHRIVTALGGEIAVSSKVGHGTQFTVRLPVAHTARIEAVSATEDAPRVRSTRRGRILALDDDTMVGASVARVFAQRHDVTVVESSKEALALLAGGARFEVILCDLLMPEITGIDFFHELERTLPKQSERIVFMTGGAFTADEREFLERVQRPVVDKPFALPELRALVDELCATRVPDET
jgi:signal transduction histidine kinase